MFKLQTNTESVQGTSIAYIIMLFKNISELGRPAVKILNKSISNCTAAMLLSSITSILTTQLNCQSREYSIRHLRFTVDGLL